jgi:hypothetical protein
MKPLLTPLLVLALSACATTGARPTGEDGEDAEALADRMLLALNAPAWEQTGAIRFRMPGRPPLLWDRARGYVEATYDDGRVLLELETRRAVVVRGDEVSPASAAVAENVYATWANDSFWLLAPLKVRDPGTRRSVVELDGKRQLLVEYGAGGVTPGDAYLWELDDESRPVAWRMWVQVLPVGGLRVGWEDYSTLSTGAVVAGTRNWGLGLKLRLEDIEAAARVAELAGGSDPFAPLMTREPASAP